MSRFIKIPTHILDSKISASAKLLWIELARVSSPKRPQVVANPKALAEKMGLSVSTVRRIIRELVKAELLVHNGGYIERRLKTYDLVWLPVKAAVQKPEPQELTPELLENWSKRFPCLDGHSGRPTLIQAVEQAVLHPLRDKNQDLKTWVEISLKNTSRLWSESYHAEKYHLDERFQAAVHR